jgi:hypothetical protein
MKFDDSLVLDGSLTRADTNIVLQITDLKMSWLYIQDSNSNWTLEEFGHISLFCDKEALLLQRNNLY